MNLLKVLQSLSPQNPEGKKDIQDAPVNEQAAPQPTPPPMPVHNAMADVLVRHEQISNRIKSSRRAF
ncbi:MAG: hypothetical protein HDP34_02715 [Clostridia bacterium]|nr:hypothetical protein [Clostridia bacterium]